MFPLLYFVLTLIVLSIATYTDFKERIIPDKLTYPAIFLGLFLHLLETLLLNNNSFFVALLHTIAAFIFAYILWLFGVWAGGDVKIFTAVIALTPTNFSFFNIFKFDLPFFIYFFIATVLLMAPYPLLLAAKRTIFNKKLRKDFISRIKTLPSMIPNILMLSIFAVALNLLFPFSLALLTSFLLFAFIFFFPTPAKAILTLVFAVFAMLSKKEIFFWQVLQTFFYLSLAFMLLKSVLIFFSISVKALHKKKKISELKDGDIPAKQLVLENNTYVWRSFSFADIIKYLRAKKFNRIQELLKPKNVVISTKAAGLTQEDIEKLKKLAKDSKIAEEIEIKESAPMAQAMLLAYILLQL